MREHVAEAKSPQRALTPSRIERTGAEQHGAPIRDRSYGDGASASGLFKALQSGSRVSSSYVSRSLLQMQRTYGNHYVRRFLALARQGEGEAEVTLEVESAIERSRGGGQALDTTVLRQMESAFGADFSGVRIHTGAEPHALNRAVNAVAFTTGQDIFFRDRAYDPVSSGGKELLAHELTHVVQQSGGEIKTKLAVSEPGDRSEQEADLVAKSVVRTIEAGETTSSIPISRASDLVQRQCACGGCKDSNDECPECQKKRLHRRSDPVASDRLRAAESNQVETGSRAMSGLSFSGALTTVTAKLGSGQTLDRESLSFMQTRFGHDFSSVRLHHDSRGAQAAQLIGAKAFTVGEHIIWAASANPATPKGRQLLAHELVHVLQQRQAGVQTSPVMDYAIVDGGASEREADRIAGSVVNGIAAIDNSGPSLAKGSLAGTQRQPVSVSAAPRTAQLQDDGGGQSFTDCVNSCLSSQGIAGAITTLIWIACGIIGGIGSLGGTLIEPGGGTLTGLGLALAGCIAVGTGFPIGVIIRCITNCAGISD